MADRYLKEPYSRVIIPDKDSETYSAKVLEFPGCFAEGRTPEEAYENLEKAAESWIDAALEMGQEIPLPQAKTPEELVQALENLSSQLVSQLERECVNVTILAVKRLAIDAGAVAWWQPRLPIPKAVRRRRGQQYDYCPVCGSKDFSGCPVCEYYL